MLPASSDREWLGIERLAIASLQRALLLQNVSKLLNTGQIVVAKLGAEGLGANGFLDDHLAGQFAALEGFQVGSAMK